MWHATVIYGTPATASDVYPNDLVLLTSAHYRTGEVLRNADGTYATDAHYIKVRAVSVVGSRVTLHGDGERRTVAADRPLFIALQDRDGMLVHHFDVDRAARGA